MESISQGHATPFRMRLPQVTTTSGPCANQEAKRLLGSRAFSLFETTVWAAAYSWGSRSGDVATFGHSWHESRSSWFAIPPKREDGSLNVVKPLRLSFSVAASSSSPSHTTRRVSRGNKMPDGLPY